MEKDSKVFANNASRTEDFHIQKKRKISGRISPRVLFGSLKEESEHYNSQPKKEVLTITKSNAAWKPPIKLSVDTTEEFTCSQSQDKDQIQNYSLTLKSMTPSKIDNDSSLIRTKSSESSLNKNTASSKPVNIQLNDSTFKEVYNFKNEQEIIDITSDKDSIDSLTHINDCMDTEFTENSKLNLDETLSQQSANRLDLNDSNCQLNLSNNLQAKCFQSETNNGYVEMELDESSGTPKNTFDEELNIQFKQDHKANVCTSSDYPASKKIAKDDFTQQLNAKIQVEENNQKTFINSAISDVSHSAIEKSFIVKDILTQTEEENKAILYKSNDAYNNVSRDSHIKLSNYSSTKHINTENVNDNFVLTENNTNSKIVQSSHNTQEGCNKIDTVESNIEVGKISLNTMYDNVEDTFVNSDFFQGNVSNSQFLQLENEMTSSEKRHSSETQLKVKQIDQNISSLGNQIEWQRTILKRMINSIDELK